MTSLSYFTALVLSTLVAIASVVLSVAIAQPNLSVCVVLSILCLLLSFINALIHYDKSGAIDLFSPPIIFPVFYIGMFTVALIMFIMDVGYSRTAEWTYKDMLYVLNGLLFYAFGNILAISFSSRRIKLPFGTIMNEWKSKAFFGWTLFVIAIGSAGAVIYYSEMGIPLLGDVNKIRHGFQGRTYGAGFSLYLLQGMNLILLARLVFGLKGRMRLRSALILLPIVWTAMFSVVGGYRWVALILILAPLTMYNYIIKRLRITPKNLLFFISALLIVVSLFSLLGYHRRISKEGGIETYLSGLHHANIPVSLQYVAPALLDLQVRVVNLSVLTRLVPQEYDFFYGKYLLAHIPGLGRIVPALSREHIAYYITDNIFGQDYRAGSGGTALTLVGGFYIDFGFLGIMIGSMLTGIFVERCYLRIFKKENILSIAIYSFVLWTSVKWITSGVVLGDLMILIAMLAIDKCFTVGRRPSPFSSNENPPHQ